MRKFMTEKRPVAIAGSDDENASRLALLNEASERAARQAAHVIAGVHEEEVGSSGCIVHRGQSEQGQQFPAYHGHGLSDGSPIPVGRAAAREMQAGARQGDRAPVCCGIGQQPSGDGAGLVG